jgi:glycosyltransferase involved in cell wall biosynthesis
MHIVLVNQWFPPESGWGGVGMHNYTLAHAYRELGHRVTVIASRLDPQIPETQETDGVRVRRLLVSDAHRARRLPVIGCYVRPLQQLAYSRRVDQTLHEIRRARQIDVVEFADVNAEGFFFARRAVTAVVVRCHTPSFLLKRYYQPREMPFDTRLTGWCEKDLIRRALALSAPSVDMARVIAQECGLPTESISVIPNPLALPECRQTFGRGDVPTFKRPPTILYVGRLERAKGVETLARAIPRVLRECPGAHFVFVGDDRPTSRGTSQRAELEAVLRKAGVEAKVTFAGLVDQPALLDRYRRADICAVPSMLYESFSYTCAQAMAAGKPVVASRVGGIPETVDDGETGILIDPGNVNQLADSIARLAKDPELRAAMGRAGRAKVAREFDPIKIARQNLEVYERARETFQCSYA